MARTLDFLAGIRSAGVKLWTKMNAELASDDPRPTTLARLSAEIRHCERQSLQMLERVQLTPEPVKSPRHQRAARTRWDRRDRANQPVAEEQNTPAVRSISGGHAASPPPTNESCCSPGIAAVLVPAEPWPGPTASSITP